MTLLMLLFWLIAGGTLQAAVPAWRHMGQPAFPVALGVVLYAAFSLIETRVTGWANRKNDLIAT